jgi:rhomboid protease GluP
MTTQTFGRRGGAPRIAVPISASQTRVDALMPRPRLVPSATAAVAAPAIDQAPDDPDTAAAKLDRNLVADIPFLTAGLIVLLTLIYGLEKVFAFSIDKGGDLSIHSLVAFGAVSRDLVVGSFEIWRIPLAPLLHASASHLIGNCVALFCVGMRLEPMIGRGWFVMIFIASALGGSLGSMIGNPPDMPSVGASGAITGLVGALFVMSFHHRAGADPLEQKSMRKTSLFFGIPALLPLLWAASSGGTDYFAHAGGALAGVAIGLSLCVIWPAGQQRPDLGRPAAKAAFVALGIAVLCGAIAALQYRSYAAEAAHYISASELPTNLLGFGTQRSADLVARYPKDPRAYLVRAVALLEANRLPEAEAALRKAMELAVALPGGSAIRNQSQAILAIVLAEQGRRNEAKVLAAQVCNAKGAGTIKRMLDKAALCT